MCCIKYRVHNYYSNSKGAVYDITGQYICNAGCCPQAIRTSFDSKTSSLNITKHDSPTKVTRYSFILMNPYIN